MNFALDASSADGIQDGGGNLRQNLDLSGFVKPLFDAQLSFETKKIVFRASIALQTLSTK